MSKAPLWQQSRADKRYSHSNRSRGWGDAVLGPYDPDGMGSINGAKQATPSQWLQLV